MNGQVVLGLLAYAVTVVFLTALITAWLVAGGVIR